MGGDNGPPVPPKWSQAVFACSKKGATAHMGHGVRGEISYVFHPNDNQLTQSRRMQALQLGTQLQTTSALILLDR